MPTKFKIHPAIGIARVGDSTTDFYLAPESSGALPIEANPDGTAALDKNGNEQPISTFKDGSYTDGIGRVKRQGARFRVYTYDDQTPNGRELKIGDEITVVNSNTGQTITGQVSNISWTVYLANKKASWYKFQQLDGEHGYSPDHPLRNATITDAALRQQLIIDPGPQTISYTDPNSAPSNPSVNIAQFAQGSNPGYAQTFPPALQPFSVSTLGEIMATQQVVQQNGNKVTYNRLVVLGGYGNSGSMIGGFGEPHIESYANNDGWFDDISDGPVLAQINYNVLKVDGDKKVPTGKTGSVTVDASAWVVVGYPRYAPQITDIITMYDAIHDVAIRYQAYDINIYGVSPFDGTQSPPDPKDRDAMRFWRGNAIWNQNYYPFFWRDIWPILSRPNNYSVVLDFEAFQGGDPHNDTPGAGGRLDPNILSQTPSEGGDKFRRQRQFVFNILRKAGQENLLAVPADQNNQTQIPHAMPLLCGDNPISNTLVSKFLRLTDTQLFFMKQWAEGKFVNERDEHFPPQQQPTTNEPTGAELDKGVLSNALGGSFCPGAETSWIIRNPAIFSEPFRIHSRLKFDVTGTLNLNDVTPGSLSLPSVINGADDTVDMSTGMEPGDITKYSGVPWQSDFNECSTQPIDITYEQWNQIYPDSVGDPVVPDSVLTYWWPAHRPMGVTKSDGHQMAWSQGVPQSNIGDLKMVTAWKYLGFIKNNPAFTDPTSAALTGTPEYIQVERNNDLI